MNWTASNVSVTESTVSTVLKTSAYSLVLLLSLVGNSLVIAIMYRDKKMRTITNYWIANMAASDLIFPFFACPYNIAQIFTGANAWLLKGRLGSATCKLVIFLGDVSTAISIQSMVFIAVERFCAVKFPLLVSSLQPKMKLFIPMTWLLAFAVHGPYFYAAKLVSQGGKTFCFLSFPPPLDRRIYFLAVFVLLYVLPFTMLVILYTSIVIQLKKSKHPTENISTSSRRQAKLRNQNNLNILIVSFVIVFLFFLCFSPIIFSVLLATFWEVRISSKMQFTTTFFAQSYPAWNPIVYFVFSNNFKSGLKHICSKKKERETNSKINFMSSFSRKSFRPLRSVKFTRV